MYKKYKLKLATVSVITILLLNTSTSFAFTLKSFAYNRNSQTSSSSTITNNVIQTLSNRIKELINENKKKVQQTQKKIEDAKKRMQDLQATKTENLKVQAIQIPGFEENAKQSESSANTKEYAKSLLGKYITNSEETITMLSDVMTSIRELNINRTKIKTAISQLLKAIQYTSASLPTKLDMNNLGNAMKSYYYLDKDESGNLISDDVEVTYTSLQDMARFTNYAQVGYERANGAPIGIGKVKVHTVDTNNNTVEDIDDVYYITLSGTNFTEGQSCGLIADVLSGIETNSPYLQKATKAVLENVPKGSKIMIAGFSLGGMMSQQLMVQEEIISNYEIISVSLLGCPAICVEERAELYKKYNVNIPVNRVIDKYDLIPYLSVDWLLNNEPKEIIENLYREDTYTDTKIYKTFLDAHVLAYMEQSCYQKYDVLCNPTTNGKQTSITFKHGDFKYYDAPTKFLHGYISKYE